jgi:PhzF family phenazine biosynthesis protein
VNQADFTSALPFDIVDVFTDVAGQGNPVAVIHDAESVSAERMQKAASWLGLPETVFVRKKRSVDADYAVRIFAPLMELPFAGHPSIGALAAVRMRNAAFAQMRIVKQECSAGLVSMQAAHNSIGFVTPSPAVVRAMNVTEIAGALAAVGIGQKPVAGYISHTGARWVILLFDDHSALATAIPNQNLILEISKHYGASGITIVSPSPDPDAQHELRSFAPAIGVAEDAVCGGGNASAAAAIHVYEGRPCNYVASQGRHLGRHGRVTVCGPLDDARFLVGGASVVVASGMINI